ncbi:N-acetylglucosamine kinase [Glutamicibacter sp. X7]
MAYLQEHHLNTRESLVQHELLAVDAGQTGIKLAWTQYGQTQELTLPGVLTNAPILPQIAAAIDRAAEHAGGGFDTVTVGSTGLTRAEHDASRLLCGSASIRRVLLAHDSVTSYLGALGDAPGAVVAAGTGVVTLGVGADSVARVDGWGHVMGDAGSGYWVGQQALIAVMRAYDGRGDATELTGVVQRLWEDLEEAYIHLQSNPQRVAQVAALAKVVSELAGTDRVAAQICAEAGAELALSVHTALSRVSASGGNVATLGGVFGSSAVASAFSQKLSALRPNAVIVPAQANGLKGSARLAELVENHPLMQLVSRAGIDSNE